MLYRELLAESGIPYSQQLDLLCLFDERLSRAKQRLHPTAAERRKLGDGMTEGRPTRVSRMTVSWTKQVWLF